MALIDNSFFQETFMPHGYCLQWRPDILWLNVISDLLIAAAYFSIPIALILFIRKRKDIQFKGVFVLFALFILLCGITHLMAIYNMWHGAYGLHGVMKALTALVSIITAYVAFRSLDEANHIPSRKEFELALEEAANEKLKTKKLEIEKRGQEIFKFTTELLPAGLLVIDELQNIVMVNASLCKIFGYKSDELLGKNLSLLIDKDKTHHSILVSQYMKSPEQSHQMAAGRVVRGVHKDGHLVDVQINLSVHEYEGEKHTFASVTDFGSFLFEQEQKNELGNRLNRAIDASDDGIWEWNVQNNHVWYSPQLMKLIGQGSKQAHQLEDWLGHIHPEDSAKVNAALENHFLDRIKFDLSYRGLAPSGQYEWFRTRGDTIFDQNGQPILMSGILSNINDTKNLESKLAEQSKFLNEVLERSLTGLYIFDLQSQSIVYVNPEYTNLTGYGLEELQAIHKQSGVWSLYHPDDLAHLKQHQIELTEPRQEEDLGVEYRFKHKSGDWKWLYSRESIYSVSEDGTPNELLGALFDITELKQREYEIRKLAIDYSTTFEQAGVGIAHINLDYSFIKANAKFLEIFRYSVEKQYELNFLALCDDHDCESLSYLIGKLRESKEPLFHVEKRFLRSSGETFWADITMSFVHSSSLDSSDYFILILEDISQRKIMEHNLSESNLALERFAYSASHDLQEPLRKISAFSGALDKRLKETNPDPEILFQLDRITDASIRMGKMIDNLLKLSRATSSSLSIRPVSLSSMLIQALDDLSAKLSCVDISVNLKKDVLIAVDPNAFGQVLRNLISNSIVYRNIEKKIIINIYWKNFDKHISITYEDNGCGISAEKLEAIFEPFRRLVGKNIPGTGMGLTICRQVMKAHKGRIFAVTNDRREAQGAVFILELPKLSILKQVSAENLK